VAGRDYLVARFLDALEAEIGWLDKHYEVDTVFFGGGTPSHLSAKNLERLNAIVRSRFEISKFAEVTAECNPGDLNADRAAALAACGVTRISLGVQSLSLEKLNILERDHSREVVEQAMTQARSFANSVSLDLIFAAPGESMAQWKSDLADAIQLAPDHFSTYELTYEKGTQFWNRRARRELESADEDLRCRMYEHAMDTLARHGYRQYEISSFAKLGHESRHNHVYWSGDPYFAFGPGAARYVDGIRETNHPSTLRYLKQVEAEISPVASSEKLSPEASARELLAIGLRRLRGVNFRNFKNQTGFSVDELIAKVRPSLQQLGLVEIDSENIRLTRAGILVCDSVAREILD
jgi:oxygen-independent coproporphyrinogen-3 oxidase